MKLELKHLISYLPYDLEYANITVWQYGLTKPLIGQINSYNIMNFIEFETTSKPILNTFDILNDNQWFVFESVFGLTKNQILKTKIDNLPHGLVQEFFKLKIDVYNLIENNLTYDYKKYK